MNKQSILDGLLAGESVGPLDGRDGNVKLEGFGIDVTNIDTTFVSEKDSVAFTARVYADVVFSVGRMGEEGFEDEGGEWSRDRLDLKGKE